MQVLPQLSRLGVISPAHVIRRPLSVRHAAIAAQDSPEAQEASTSGSKGGEIYVGFEKGDYKPRTGRKGRVIQDDPSKYPDKEDLGPLPGVVGGWAGGELGVKAFAAEAELEVKKAAAKAVPAERTVPPVASGKDTIYVGFGKDELELKKSGAKGRVIKGDDARIYPDKEDIGFLAGVTGGFAGGERGLKTFIEKGSVNIAEDDADPQFSPLVIALIASVAAVGGALLLEASQKGEEVVQKEIVPLAQAANTALSAPSLANTNTQLLLQIAVALTALTVTVAGTRYVLRSVGDKVAEGKEKVAEGASTAVKLAAFWVGVFFAVRFVLDF